MDFRVDGQHSFFSYLSFCQLGSNMIAKAEAVFFADEFVTAQALSSMWIYELFREHIHMLT